MTIKELIKSVSDLVGERQIIDHGTIRCLFSENAVREIKIAEGCDSVDTSTIGDDDLAEKLRDLAENDQEGGIDFDALKTLEDAYLGENATDYVDEDKEDNLTALDALIDAVREVAQ